MSILSIFLCTCSSVLENLFWFWEGAVRFWGNAALAPKNDRDTNEIPRPETRAASDDVDVQSPVHRLPVQSKFRVDYSRDNSKVTL